MFLTLANKNVKSRELKRCCTYTGWLLCKEPGANLVSTKGDMYQILSLKYGPSCAPRTFT